MKQTHCPTHDVGEVLQLLGVLTRELRQSAETQLPEPLRAAFAEGALGPRHLPPLFALTMGGPASVGDLAARISLAPTTTSLLVNELSRAGLVERREDDSDRRRTIVDVAEHVRDALAAHASTRVAIVQRALDRLEPEARAHFLQGLRALVEEAK